MKHFLLIALMVGLLGIQGWASDFAPAVPELDLPTDVEATESSQKMQSALTSTPKAPKTQTPKKSPSTTVKKPTVATQPKTKKAEPIIEVNTTDINKDLVSVEKVTIDPKLLVPISQEPVIEPETPTKADTNKADSAAKNPAVKNSAAKNPAAKKPGAEEASSTGNTFVPGRDKAAPTTAEARTVKVVYNPRSDRDPTLSPDDTLLLRHREEERQRALEAERQRKIEAERRRLAELERQRQLELERLRDPSREVRGKIRISGIIGQEVFIGDKVYTVGKSVLGARIVSVQPDAVVFTYKGQKFTKKVQLQ